MTEHLDDGAPWWHSTLMTKHPDDRAPWWQSILMTRHLDDRASRQNTLMTEHPDDRARAPWQSTLMIKHLDERAPWWQSTLMTEHLDESSLMTQHLERVRWWQSTLMIEHPDNRASWWQSTLMIEHLDERVPWWQSTFRESTLMTEHPDDRAPWWQSTLRPPWSDTTLMRDYPADRAPWRRSSLFCTYLSHPHSRGNSRGGLPTSLSSSSSDSFTHWASHVWGTGTHHHRTNVNNLGVSETVLQLWETERDREKSVCGYIMYVGVGVCAGFCLNDHISVTSLKPHRLPPSLSLLVPKIMASLYNCVTMRTPLPSSLAPIWLGIKHHVTYFPPLLSIFCTFSVYH